MYLVVDLEATCSEGGSITRENCETIEIGAVLVHPRSMKPVTLFSTFVRPTKEPVLTDFCMKLTSISQEMVDEAPPFRTGYGVFCDWVKSYTNEAIFCSWVILIPSS